VRSGQEVRTTAVTVEGTGAGEQARVVSGLTGLTVLKSTDSEFRGFLADSYTTLPETGDRVLATSLTARWRYAGPAAAETDWLEAYDQVRRILLARFAELHSLALQQSLWEMGHAVLTARPDIAEIRLSAPNKHHYLVDLEPFGLTNRNEVFYAGDRPYGLIQCTAIRDDGPPAGPAWDTSASFG
jgi:urate oxidase